MRRNSISKTRRWLLALGACAVLPLFTACADEEEPVAYDEVEEAEVEVDEVGEADVEMGEMEPAALAQERNQPTQARTGQVQYTEEREGGQLTAGMMIPITGEGGLQVNRKAPEQVRVGEAYTYQIEITNTSGQPLHQVVLTETVSGGLAQSGTAQQQQQQGQQQQGQQQGQQQQMAQEGQQQRMGDQNRWTVGSLMPGESKTVEGRVRANAQGTGSTCLLVDYQPAICADVEIVKPELALTREIVAEGGPTDRAYVCDEVFVIYTVRNEGSGATEDVTIMEDLPQGVTYEGNNQVEIDVGALEAGQSEQVRAPLEVENSTSFSGYAIARAGDLEVQSEESGIQIIKPELEVALDGPGQHYIDREATYTITVRNTSDFPAPNAQVRLQLPEDASRVTVASQQVEREGDTFTLGTLEGGESRSFDVSFEVSEPGEMEIQAAAQAYCAAAVQDALATNIRGIPALQLSVIDMQDPVTVGNEATYVIRVYNEGTAEDLAINMQASLPEGMQFVRADGPTNVQAQGQNLSFGEIERLAPGEEVEYEVIANANQAKKARFEVLLKSDFMQRQLRADEPTTLY